ncbi:prepilin peptidase [Erythrobacter sp. MTPC3]|uniref:A24 family peptidase n=1 Tax=Erythrobacter sp. MTPC3 TaxID=3056564 RepID=UPI0036F26938
MEMTAPIIATALLLVAAWLDVSKRLLPNWLALILFLVGIGGALLGSTMEGAGLNLLHSGIALAVGFGLFAIGWIGGGDAKTYAALAASFPLAQGFSLLGLVALCMGVISFFWIVIARWRRRRKRAEGTLPKDQQFAKVPVGLAIAAGGITMFWGHLTP